MAEKEAYSGTFVDDLSVEDFRDEVVDNDLRPFISEEHIKKYPAYVLNRIFASQASRINSSRFVFFLLVSWSN